jgi:glycosyltransferase involved in cell wall biosynthesis
VWTFLSAVWRDTDRLVREFAPEVVIASSTYPMDIWVARRIARLARARLVYEVHDLWPLSPMELFDMPRWHPFIMLCQRAEDTAYRDADTVVSMLPKVHDYMASRGLDLRKLCIVPNGITLEEWQGDAEALGPAVQFTLQAAQAAGKTLVGYAGSHGIPNALDTLLDAAALLRDEPLHFVLVGDGHEKATPGHARAGRRPAQREPVAGHSRRRRSRRSWPPSTSPTSAGSACPSTASASRRTS